MSKRMVDPTFWDDPTIGDLHGHAKYLFLYLISSPRGNSCGLFDISNRVIQFHTGMTVEKIDEAMKVLEDTGRIVRRGNTVWVVNQFKHDPNHNNLLVRIQFLNLIDKFKDLGLIKLIMDKYKAQLTLDHGLPKGYEALTPALKKRLDSFRISLKVIKLRLSPPSAEPYQRLHEHEHGHDDDHDHVNSSPENDGTLSGVLDTDEAPVVDGPWAGVPVWLVNPGADNGSKGALQKAFKHYDYQDPPEYFVDRVSSLVASHPRETLEQALRICGENAAHSIGYVDTVIKNGANKQAKAKAAGCGVRPSSKFAYNQAKGTTRPFLKGDELQEGEELI